MGEEFKKQIVYFLRTEKEAEYKADQMVLKLLYVRIDERVLLTQTAPVPGFCSAGLGVVTKNLHSSKFPSDAVYC